MNHERQRVLDFILAYQREHGRRPTYERIAEDLGIATKTAGKHVKKLEKSGEITLIYASKKAQAARV